MAFKKVLCQTHSLGFTNLIEGFLFNTHSSNERSLFREGLCPNPPSSHIYYTQIPLDAANPGTHRSGLVSFLPSWFHIHLYSNSKVLGYKRSRPVHERGGLQPRCPYSVGVDRLRDLDRAYSDGQKSATSSQRENWDISAVPHWWPVSSDSSYRSMWLLISWLAGLVLSRLIDIVHFSTCQKISAVGCSTYQTMDQFNVFQMIWLAPQYGV